MDATALVVTIAGLALVVFVLWFFFSRRPRRPHGPAAGPSGQSI